MDRFLRNQNARDMPQNTLITACVICTSSYHDNMCKWPDRQLISNGAIHIPSQELYKLADHIKYNQFFRRGKREEIKDIKTLCQKLGHRRFHTEDYAPLHRFPGARNQIDSLY